jgi:ABC-type Fe3+ transport system substrate-binding protein
MGHPEFGEEYHRALAKQDLVFTRDIGQSERRVARGEYPIWVPQVSVNIQGLKGLPVRVIMPKEGVAYVRLDQGMLKNAPHPNAARLFMNYYISEENQLMIASMGYFYLSNRYTLSAFLGEALEEPAALAHWQQFITEAVLRTALVSPPVPSP